MEPKLTIVGGKANKRRVSLKLPTIIGRSREADLTIAHPMVSRQHCQLFEAKGLLRIRDMGSLNGTFVCGRQITEAPLRPSDEFTVGPITFRVDYQYDGEVTKADPSAPPEDTVTSQTRAMDEPTAAAKDPPHLSPAKESAMSPQGESTPPLPGVAPQPDFPSATSEPLASSGYEEQGAFAAPPETPEDEQPLPSPASPADAESEPPGLFSDAPIPDFSAWASSGEVAPERCRADSPPPAGCPENAAGEEEPEPVAPPCLRVVAPQALSTKIECTKSESAKIDPAIAANGSPLPSAEPRVPERAGEREEEPIPLDEVAQSWEEPAPDGVEDESLDPELEAFLRGMQ